MIKLCHVSVNILPQDTENILSLPSYFLIVWDICYLSHCHSFFDYLFFFQVSTNPFSLYSLVLLYVEQIWSYLLYFLLSEFSLCFHLGFWKCLVIILQNSFTSLPFPDFKTNKSFLLNVSGNFSSYSPWIVFFNTFSVFILILVDYYL